MAALPPGAQRSTVDPYAEEKSPWKSYLFILLLLGGLGYLWHTGHINEGTIDQVRKHFAGEKPAITSTDTAKPGAPAKDADAKPEAASAVSVEPAAATANEKPVKEAPAASTETPAPAPLPAKNTPPAKPAPATK